MANRSRPEMKEPMSRGTIVHAGRELRATESTKKKESVASLSCLAVGANRGKKQRIANEACLNCGCGDLDLFRLIIDMPNEARGSE